MSEDSKTLRSVGMDIGSTTTHLVFSKLVLKFDDERHKFEIASKNITYVSRIWLTPYTVSDSIDVDKLSSILLGEYKAAGCSTQEIDTGAIIITGDAAKKHNAERIVNLFSDQIGKFVCATAGPKYEAILAAHGSGAVEQSGIHSTTIMNVDIGGGTSKIAIVHKGEIVDTACVSIGARPIVIDGFGRVVRVEDTAEILTETNKIPIALGEILSEADQHRIGETCASCLCEVIKRGHLSDITRRLMVTPPLSYRGKVDTVTFSGGVAEYIYGHTDKEFGDLGKVLGEAIVRASRNLGISISEPAEKIRATVIGASQYTVQISGNTTFISDPGLLPVRNLQVVSLDLPCGVVTEETIEVKIKSALERCSIVEGYDEFALGFRRSVMSVPSYNLMKTLGRAVISALKTIVEKERTLVLVFEADIGMGIGRIIHEELEPRCKLVSIDEIKLQDFSFIDIGKPTGKDNLIAVVVKSLIFRTAQE